MRSFWAMGLRIVGLPFVFVGIGITLFGAFFMASADRLQGVARRKSLGG